MDRYATRGPDPDIAANDPPDHCDPHIAELRTALCYLTEAVDAPQHRQDIAALQERLASLESRLTEQERIVRHTLSMLIDWIERDGGPHVAA